MPSFRAMTEALAMFLQIIQSRNTKTIRLTAIGEAGVSRHHGGSIEGLPETILTSQHYSDEGFKGALNWAAP